MKTTSLIIALAVVTATATSALASDKAASAKPSKIPAKKVKASTSAVQVQQEKNVELTGSYIKRDVRRASAITDGPSPVYVLDQTMIERSGAADLSQVLIRTGFRR